MSCKVDQDPVTGRWFIYLLDEPGRPRLEADNPKVLEDLWNDISSGNVYRATREKRSTAASARC